MILIIILFVLFIFFINKNIKIQYGPLTSTTSTKSFICKDTIKILRLGNCKECPFGYTRIKCRKFYLWSKVICEKTYETKCSNNPSCGNDKFVEEKYCNANITIRSIEIPRFGVNNPNPFFEDAKISGAKIAKILPIEWSWAEPFPPLAHKKPLNQYSISDLGLDKLPDELQEQVKVNFDTILKKMSSGNIQQVQDTRGMWHLFNWDEYDDFVIGAQSAGLETTFLLHLNTLWASDPDCLLERFRSPKGTNCPLRDSTVAQDVSFFVQSLVERYDGDGLDDMPGLIYPIRFWSDGNEYNVPTFWNGTNEEYLVVWKAFSKGVRQADPKNSIILANGIAKVNDIRNETTNGVFSPCKALKVLVNEKLNDADLQFENLPEKSLAFLNDCQEQTEMEILKTLEELGVEPKIINGVEARLAWRKRSAEFLMQQLDHPELYDIFVPHVYTYFHYDPTRVAEEMNFIFSEMKARGYKKQVLSEELAGAYLRDKKFPEGESILQSILNGNKPETIKYMRELSIEMVKLHTTMFAHGSDGLILYPFRDISPENPWGTSGYAVQGMVVVDWATGKIALRKPSYYTYQIMTSKIGDFQSAREIQPGVIEFTFMDRNPVYVLWSNDAPYEFDLSPYFSADNVKITQIVTDLDSNNNPIYPSDLTISADSVPISYTPIFVEEVKKVERKRK